MIRTIVRTRILLLLAAGIPGLAHADNYVINFFEPLPGPYTGTLPSSGSFTYDPVAGFSNFLVAWNGATYDLTSSANSPTVLSSGCPGEAATPQYGFAMLTEAPSGCPSNTALLAPYISNGFIWEGNVYGPPDFQFTVFTDTGNDTIIAYTTAGNYQTFEFVRGTWTVTDISSTGVPEPATLGMFLGAIALAVAAKTRFPFGR